MDLQLCEGETPDAVSAMAERIAERKLDGVRCYTEDGRLYTRSGRDVTAQFPEIDAPEHHVFDGELITGAGEFETVLRRVQTEDSFKIELLADQSPARLIVFDALRINGGDVTAKPLLERKDLLEPSIPADSGIHEIPWYDLPERLWVTATENEWEGIILKKPESPYSGGRSDDWLKVKNWSDDTFPIIKHGHTENDGFVIYVEIGADEPQKVVVNGQDDQAVIQNGADADEIQYLERTDDGRLRKPSFKGVA